MKSKDCLHCGKQFATEHTSKLYCCKLCQKKLVAGHCHARGLLCSTCNSGIGFFSDDISRLESAILHLRERGAPQ